MAKRLDYAELMAYRRSMLNGLSDRQERLARVRRNLTTLINGGSLKGAAAKASNQYLQEVYLQGLLKSFDETIENLRQVLAQYVGGYTSVDPSPDFYLSDEEYDNLNDKIKSQFHKADRVLDGLVSAGNKVSDLLPGSHLTDMQMDGDLTVADLHSELPHIIDDQQDAWANYEKSSEELTKNADLLLQDIGHVISQYMGQPAVRMNGYVAGSFRQMLGAKLLADTAQVSQVDQDNVHLMGQYAKLLKDQWKSHVAYVKKVLQAKKEEMKKQGWVNLLFEAVVTAVAVGAAVAAAVAMGPLVAGIAVAATALFPVSRMIGEYHQATTGEDGDRYDFIKNGFVYAFGKSNGEIAYQVADIGLSIVGSTSALNEFSKVFGVASAKELKIGGLSFVKSVLSAETSGEVKSIVISKSKDILSNARNNIKATWTSKVTVHSLFEGADQTTVLNNASKSMADNFKLVTAAKGDFSQMGEVFKSIRSANSILHNPVIKEHAARKEVIQTITKSFGEAYGKETLKKGAEKAADQYVIDPLLEKGLGIPEEPTSVSGKFVQYAGEKWGKKFGEGVFNLGKTDIITHNPFVRSVLEGAH